MIEDKEITQKAGLDSRFTAKLMRLLQDKGIDISCSLTTEELIEALTALYKGGVANA